MVFLVENKLSCLAVILELTIFYIPVYTNHNPRPLSQPVAIGIARCLHCDSSFTRKTTLNKHLADKHEIKSIQNMTKRYSCPFCGHAEFRTNTDLASHCEEVHNNKLGN